MSEAMPETLAAVDNLLRAGMDARVMEMDEVWLAIGAGAPLQRMRDYMNTNARRWLAKTPAGVYQLSKAGMTEARRRNRADLPPPAAPAVVYAEIHARAIAAEERAQCLAEKLDDERKARERAERELREAGEEFAQVRMLDVHLRKKARRLRKRLAEIESVSLSLSMIKDPTAPF